jgi:enoyl-CoA hydratase/carnithine racemase
MVKRPGSTDLELPDELRWELDGAVGRLTLNRPSKLNTMTPSMGQALLQLVQAINDDERVRVVILTGAGERAFSAGSDVSVLDDYGSNWDLRNRVDYARGIWGIRKPVVAKIRGYCVGGGLEMALMSDIRYASPDASFGAGEIKLGWHGGAGNTQLLPRVAGPGRALEMLLTGDLVDAAEASRIGVVDRVVPADLIDAAVDDLAARIAANAPIATQLSKHMVRMSMSTSIEVGLAYENDTFTYCFTTDDSREGREAFRDKRRPNFTGR